MSRASGSQEAVDHIKKRRAARRTPSEKYIRQPDDHRSATRAPSDHKASTSKKDADWPGEGRLVG